MTNFKMNGWPDREPVEITEYFCDAGDPGGLGSRALYYLQLFDMGLMYAIE